MNGLEPVLSPSAAQGPLMRVEDACDIMSLGNGDL